MEHEKKSKFSKDKFVWQFEMATVTALQALIMLSVFVATVIVFVLFAQGMYDNVKEIKSVTALLPQMQNVFAGVKYLSDLLDRYNGNVSMALAGYNAGPTAVKRFRGIPPYRETRGYVHRIQNLIAEGVKSAGAATGTLVD